MITKFGIYEWLVCCEDEIINTVSIQPFITAIGLKLKRKKYKSKFIVTPIMIWRVENNLLYINLQIFF